MKVIVKSIIFLGTVLFLGFMPIVYGYKVGVTNNTNEDLRVTIESTLAGCSHTIDVGANGDYNTINPTGVCHSACYSRVKARLKSNNQEVLNQWLPAAKPTSSASIFTAQPSVGAAIATLGAATIPNECASVDLSIHKSDSKWSLTVDNIWSFEQIEPT